MKTLIILLLIVFAYLSTGAQTSLGINKKLFKESFLVGINEKRAEGCRCGTTYMKPAQPLTWNDQLAQAALEHATDMYKKHYFSHQSNDGRDMQDRLINGGYGYKGFQRYEIGENIAFGQQTIDEVLTGWFKSIGHCKNLMNPAFREIGIAEKK
jgi:uncharacterized protein YkwD